MDTNHNKKPEDKKVATPVAATQPASATAVTAKPVAAPTHKAGEHAATACTAPDGKSEACPNTHDGKVVSISGSKLVMSSHEGKHYSHTVADDAKVCCDGKSCRTQDLKVGHKIRLTTKSDDNKVAIKIESLDKQAEFAQSA